MCSHRSLGHYAIHYASLLRIRGARGAAVIDTRFTAATPEAAAAKTASPARGGCTDTPIDSSVTNNTVWSKAKVKCGETNAKSRRTVHRGSRVLLCASVSFDPSIGETFSTLAVGATLCLCPRQLITQPYVLPRVIRALEVSHICHTPAVWASSMASPMASSMASPAAVPAPPSLPASPPSLPASHVQ